MLVQYFVNCTKTALTRSTFKPQMLHQMSFWRLGIPGSAGELKRSPRSLAVARRGKGGESGRSEGRQDVGNCAAILQKFSKVGTYAPDPSPS